VRKHKILSRHKFSKVSTQPLFCWWTRVKTFENFLEGPPVTMLIPQFSSDLISLSRASARARSLSRSLSLALSLSLFLSLSLSLARCLSLSRSLSISLSLAVYLSLARCLSLSQVEWTYKLAVLIGVGFLIDVMQVSSLGFFC